MFQKFYNPIHNKDPSICFFFSDVRLDMPINISSKNQTLVTHKDEINSLQSIGQFIVLKIIKHVRRCMFIFA